MWHEKLIQSYKILNFINYYYIQFKNVSELIDMKYNYAEDRDNLMAILCKICIVPTEQVYLCEFKFTAVAYLLESKEIFGYTELSKLQ